MKHARQDPFVEHVLDLLAPLGEIRARRMFGGWGIYANDIFMAIVAYDALWFKVDTINRPRFEAAGSRPFQPYEGRETVMSYWEVPGDVIDDREAMVEWAREALGAARRAAAMKSPASRAGNRR